jgi:hypothetical protein
LLSLVNHCADKAFDSHDQGVTTLTVLEDLAALRRVNIPVDLFDALGAEGGQPCWVLHFFQDKVVLSLSSLKFGSEIAHLHLKLSLLSSLGNLVLLTEAVAVVVHALDAVVLVLDENRMLIVKVRQLARDVTVVFLYVLLESALDCLQILIKLQLLDSEVKASLFLPALSVIDVKLLL